MRLVSVQIGQPRTYRPATDGTSPASPWTSAIAKEPVEGQLWAGTGGLAGDQVADTGHHGGPWQALLMYSADHYPAWRAEWQRPDLGPGAFGENLTVAGLDEETTCVGDVFRIGDTRVEVTSPRSPCQTLARHLGVPDVIRQVRETSRSGWYLRVTREGWLEAGMTVDLLDRPFPQWTVSRAAAIRADRHGQQELAAMLATCPALAPRWRDALREHVRAG